MFSLLRRSMMWLVKLKQRELSWGLKGLCLVMFKEKWSFLVISSLWLEACLVCFKAVSSDFAFDPLAPGFYYLVNLLSLLFKVQYRGNDRGILLYCLRWLLPVRCFSLFIGSQSNKHTGKFNIRKINPKLWYLNLYWIQLLDLTGSFIFVSIHGSSSIW